MKRQLTRRRFCSTMGVAMGFSAIAGACRPFAEQFWRGDGRLKVRPHSGTNSTETGRIMLGLESKRDAILQLPKRSDSPLPLLVMLHGATQSADDMLDYLGSTPDDSAIAVLAPNSRNYTWDAITDSFGADLELLNRALDRVFDKAAIDPARSVA